MTRSVGQRPARLGGEDGIGEWRRAEHVASAAAPGRSRPYVILLIEDNPADADLTREALAGGAQPIALFVARDGAEAFAFLRREGPHLLAPAPDLILLDLNLPGVDGRGVLRELKHDPALRRIPVVMLTSSSAPQDVALAYQSGANCYVTKPVELQNYLAVVRAIEHYWLAVVTLPG